MFEKDVAAHTADSRGMIILRNTDDLTGFSSVENHLSFRYNNSSRGPARAGILETYPNKMSA